MLRNLSWALRRAVWDALAIIKFRVNKPAHIPVPAPMEAALQRVPLQEVFPSIALRGVPSSKTVPRDEAKAFNRGSYNVQMWMARVFGPQMAGLPEVPADPQARLAEAYGSGKRAVFPAPLLPPEYAGAEPDLGALALAGPYYGYLQPVGDGRWHWDLRMLGAFEHRPELYNLGSRTVFEKSGDGVRPVLIECELGAIAPDDTRWPVARAIALCALTTHCGLIRHYNGVHLAIGGTLGLAVRNALPTDHPLLRLLWPHTYGTQYSNELATFSQLDPAGDFAAIYSFTEKGLYALFEKSFAATRIADYDPVDHARTNGLAAAGIKAAGAANLIDLHGIFEAHAGNYLALYYADDAELAGDAAVVRWLADFAALVPGGLPGWVRPLTRASMARLFAVLLDAVVVEHELRGGFLWNYQLWTHAHPIRVYRDGRREPVDVYQRLVNCNMTLNVHRALLLQDFSYLALDERGAAAFRDFLASLRALQAGMDKEGVRPLWRLYPDMLHANMNA